MTDWRMAQFDKILDIGGIFFLNHAGIIELDAGLSVHFRWLLLAPWQSSAKPKPKECHSACARV